MFVFVSVIMTGFFYYVIAGVGIGFFCVLVCFYVQHLEPFFFQEKSFRNNINLNLNVK